jgi:hypothetical protein
MVRRCARPTCSELAVATLSFDYAGRSVWLDHLTDVVDPATHDLCETHAERSSAPQGWTFDDRRTPVAPIWQAKAS